MNITWRQPYITDYAVTCCRETRINKVGVSIRKWFDLMETQTGFDNI